MAIKHVVALGFGSFAGVPWFVPTMGFGALTTGDEVAEVAVVSAGGGARGDAGIVRRRIRRRKRREDEEALIASTRGDRQ